MESKKLTSTEKQTLMDHVANVLQTDALYVDEYMMILQICAAACDRRIKELEKATRPSGNVQ